VEQATGIEPVLPAWDSRSAALYFQHLQNGLGKINVHATHTVHAVPDLRIAGGRLGDGFLSCVAVRDHRFEATLLCPNMRSLLLTFYERKGIGFDRSMPDEA
jgi:hypothetical protein